MRTPLRFVGDLWSGLECYWRYHKMQSAVERRLWRARGASLPAAIGSCGFPPRVVVPQQYASSSDRSVTEVTLGKIRVTSAPSRSDRCGAIDMRELRALVSRQMENDF